MLGLGLIAVLAGSGAVAGAIVAGGRDGSSAAPAPSKTGGVGPIAFAQIGSSPQPIGGPEALRRVTASLKRGRPVFEHTRSGLVSARIGPPPRWARTTATSAVVPGLYVTERVPTLKRGGVIEPTWEAQLLLGAVAELTSKSRTLRNAVGAAEFRGLLPDGRVTDLGRDDIGIIDRGQRFAAANESDAAIKKSITRVASRFGLSVDSVTVFRAFGTAPAVVLAAPDISAVSSRFQSLEAALFGFPPRYQGFYLEIRGENGKPYIRGSQAFRTGDGEAWADPSLRLKRSRDH